MQAPPAQGPSTLRLRRRRQLDPLPSMRWSPTGTQSHSHLMGRQFGKFGAVGVCIRAVALHSYLTVLWYFGPPGTFRRTRHFIHRCEGSISVELCSFDLKVFQREPAVDIGGAHEVAPPSRRNVLLRADALPTFTGRVGIATFQQRPTALSWEIPLSLESGKFVCSSMPRK